MEALDLVLAVLAVPFSVGAGLCVLIFVLGALQDAITHEPSDDYPRGVFDIVFLR